MSLFSLFKPKPTITEAEVNHGLRWMTYEGVASMGFGSITTSGFLAAYALALGANNLEIGILASLPFVTQPLQLAAIPLVDRIRLRKAISVTTWWTAQALWLPVAMLPFIYDAPNTVAVSMLLAIVAVRGVISAVTNCAWNGWVRDLVPQQILGRFYARRLALSNVMAAAFGLAAALFVDYWKASITGSPEAIGYAIPLMVGFATLGLASPFFMALMPEPLMAPPSPNRSSIATSLAVPLRDPNFKHLLRFAFMWGLALNLAVPFFAVYMLVRLQLPLSSVIALTVLSQLSNVLFLRLWGPLADKFGQKIILSLCASLYLLVVLGWTFTTMPERYFLTVPLLVVLHILAGAAASGVNLTIGTLGMKLAPQQQATEYLASASVALNLGAGLGPLLGGAFADFFSVRSLNFVVSWVSPERFIDLPAISLQGFDFLFAITFVVGLFTLNSLTVMREEGEVGREVVLDALYSPARQLSSPVSSVAALGILTFPLSILRRTSVPGLDVAAGITSYQIAQLARAAAVAAEQGRRTSRRAVAMLQDALEDVWRAGVAVPAFAADVAVHTTRGIMNALEDTAVGAGRLAHDAVTAAVKALGQEDIDPMPVFWGAGYGVVEGAHQAGADTGEAVRQALTAARTAAREQGIPEEEAVQATAQGALEAAEALSPEAEALVRAALGKE
ncbi:MAG: MFS transporter [Chloroflexi bacterium]|nr:MFS transporter [Chloroflexota bacterium]